MREESWKHSGWWCVLRVECRSSSSFVVLAHRAAASQVTGLGPFWEGIADGCWKEPAYFAVSVDLFV